MNSNNNKLNKILNNLNNKEYINELLDNINKKEYKIKFIINKKPENYVRERSGRGKHFYNPKCSKMEEYKNEMLHQMTKEQYEFTRRLLSEHRNYQVKINASFYIKTQENSSIKDSVLKELKVIVPNTRPDTDNYIKFILDSLHDVVYDDDAKVTEISAGKYYAINPRTELEITRIEKE